MVAGGSGCCHGGVGCHDGDGRRCMAEGDVVNLVDRDTRSHFGACRKISPEKLSGGGGGDDRRRPARKSSGPLHLLNSIVMSSPNHPTSDIEDAFSFNFPDYILASPDYVLASLRKSFSESSNDSFGLALIASPALLLFHDDPYMKELLPPKKRGCDRSSSSTSALPQEFKIGESSRKTNLERHEEQIKMPPKRTSTSAAPAITQDAIRKLVDDSVTATLEA
nr:hypothetical protein [Tanacetum cinerariifolium]